MNVFEEAWKNIVSPTQIKSKASMLGPWERSINGVVVKRTELIATNRNGKRIEGFLFRPEGVTTTETLLYLHGNGGCKLEALPLVEMVVEFGFNLTAFDMLGCGNSDSGLLTYGVNEVFDIRDMLEEVRKHTTVGRVTIWGRSMGSLCALMFANTYAYEVSALILDSPFRSLREVVQRIA